MPRINQLPAASSVAQTDVLAIDTTDKTYKVPRSVLAPAPFQVTIQPGYWSGSGSDYYFTVSASNVTANAQLYPFYDKASDALLNGPVWAIPAAGSFTIHTSAIPSGTVTISVLLAGIVGEAQYQVLADVYSRAQVDTIVSQSTANVIAQLDPTYDSGNIYTVGVVFAAGFVTSGNTKIYCMFDVPRRPNSNAALTMTSCKLSIRGISGYVDVFNNATTEYISTSGFTYSLSYKSNRQMELIIEKSSALTNVTNNTPILANGAISFRVS